MNVGILGTGDVGKALGRGFIALGHAVKMGARDARNQKALAWAQDVGVKGSAGTFADAASFGEVVVLATLGVANESAITMAGPEHFRGRYRMLAVSRGHVHGLGTVGDAGGKLESGLQAAEEMTKRVEGP